MVQRAGTRFKRAEPWAVIPSEQNEALIKELVACAQLDFRIAMTLTFSPFLNWSIYWGYPRSAPLLSIGCERTITCLAFRSLD